MIGFVGQTSGAAPLSFLLRLKHQEVLVGQEGLLTGQDQPRALGLFQEGLARDAMIEGRADRRRTPVVVDVHDAAVGLQRLPEALEVAGAVGEEVVGVDDEDHVAGAGGSRGSLERASTGATFRARARSSRSRKACSMRASTSIA